MAPAMAAGNTFVLKSSEKSPLALAAYGDLINEVWLCSWMSLDDLIDPRYLLYHTIQRPR